MERGAISWIELPGGDCAATGRFYGRVFGWSVEQENGSVAFRDASGGLGGMFRGDLEPAKGCGPMLYVGVDDIEQTLSAVEAEGGTTVTPRTLIDEAIGAWASFTDPAGSLMGIWEPAEPS